MDKLGLGLYDEGQQLQFQHGAALRGASDPLTPKYGGGPGYLAATAAVSAFVPILTV
jgi:hypothetical protein